MSPWLSALNKVIKIIFKSNAAGAKVRREKGNSPDRQLRSQNHYSVGNDVGLIDLHSPSEIVKQITSISIEPGVEVESATTSKEGSRRANYPLLARGGSDEK